MRVSFTCSLTDQLIFFSKLDLQRKLAHFQAHYSEDRVHSSLNLKTPKMIAEENSSDKIVVSQDHYRWESRCNGLCQLPVAASIKKSHWTAPSHASSACIATLNPAHGCVLLSGVSASARSFSKLIIWILSHAVRLRYPAISYIPTYSQI